MIKLKMHFLFFNTINLLHPNGVLQTINPTCAITITSSEKNVGGDLTTFLRSQRPWHKHPLQPRNGAVKAVHNTYDKRLDEAAKKAKVR